MKFENDYQRREWIGRQALKELQRQYPHIFKYDITFEPDMYSHYDASFIEYDYTTHNIKMRHFIEIKIRDRVFPDYILERKKVSNLHKKMDELGLKDGEYKLFYLNFCPDGTYLWNITDITPQDCNESKLMNKATSTSRRDKMNKYYRPMVTEEARKFEYIINENDIVEEEVMRRMKPQLEKKIQQKGLNWLFED